MEKCIIKSIYLRNSNRNRNLKAGVDAEDIQVVLFWFWFFEIAFYCIILAVLKPSM